MNLGDAFPAADFGLALRRVAIAFHHPARTSNATG